MRYLGLAGHFRQRLGKRARKIPLDAGFTCPNRDGTLGKSGCLFCPPGGSGNGAHARGLSLADQWQAGLARLAAKHPKAAPLAYLQAYSNTHGPIAKLEAALAEIAALPGVAGLCLGTRPDCLDDPKLDLIASVRLPILRLELGLQSADPDTLTRVARGHTPEDFARAAQAAAASGLDVVAHLMAGLPGEDQSHFLASIDFVSALPVQAVKLHNTYVARGAGLAALWRDGLYTPMALDAYAAAVASAIARLRPDIVVERLGADPAPGELLAPTWAGDKLGLLASINAELDRRDVRQGQEYRGAYPEPSLEEDASGGRGRRTRVSE